MPGGAGLGYIALGNKNKGWFDRNGITKAFNYYQVIITPHAATERWSYTVPAGKKAIVEFQNIHLIRWAVAGPAALANCWTRCTLVATGIANHLFAAILTNGVGDKDSYQSNSQFVLNAGDVISFSTGDGSTGGSMNYFGVCKVTEFDE